MAFQLYNTNVKPAHSQKMMKDKYNPQTRNFEMAESIFDNGQNKKWSHQNRILSHSNIKGNKNLQKEKKDHFERKESDHISKAVFNYNKKVKRNRKSPENRRI